MKIIFLDVDGVLNSVKRMGEILASYGDYIDRELLQIVADIIQTTDAKVVVSSNWRFDDQLMATLYCALREFGVEESIIGFTPLTLEPVTRASEIKSWLDHNLWPIEKFAIIDDWEDAGIGFESNYFQTDSKIGITESTAKQIIEHLLKE